MFSKSQETLDQWWIHCACQELGIINHWTKINVYRPGVCIYHAIFWDYLSTISWPAGSIQNQQEDKYKATECLNSQRFPFAAQSNTQDCSSFS